MGTMGGTTGNADVARLIALEEELAQLRTENGEAVVLPIWVRVIDYLMEHCRQPVRISRRKYLILALACGWFCGAHRWYANEKKWAAFYLLTCWTGIPLAMTIIDLLLLWLKYEPDEEGMITI